MSTHLRPWHSILIAPSLLAAHAMAQTSPAHSDVAPSALLEGESTLRVSVDSAGIQAKSVSLTPALSFDGRYVAFASLAANLVEDDTNGWDDVFVHDRRTGATERVSTSTSGVEGDLSSTSPSISGDGRFVAFASLASTLAPNDTNGTWDIFLRDRANGTTRRISVDSAGMEAHGASRSPAISLDGRFVAFESDATDLVPGDLNAKTDVFLHDTATSTTIAISVAVPSGLGDAESLQPSVSADGRYVAFLSRASDLVAGLSSLGYDVFVRDAALGTTTLVSVDPLGGPADLGSWHPSISSNGRLVAFESTARNLVPGDTNLADDMFVRNLDAGVTTRVSFGVAGAESNGYSGVVYSTRTISGNGRFVVFESVATNLVGADANGSQFDVFVHDRETDTTRLVGASSTGVQGDKATLRPTISADGRVVVFEGDATNLVAGDTNGSRDLFVRATFVDCPPIIAYCTPTVTSTDCWPQIGSSGVPSLSSGDAFFVSASQLPRRRLEVLLWSSTGPAATPFHGGTLCLQPPIVRTVPTTSTGGAFKCGGSASFHFSQAYMNARGLSAGAIVYGQFLGRDPGAPGGISLSDAITFTVSP